MGNLQAPFVGRLGGLACALGVGAAVFAGTGIAAADTTDSATGNSATGSERDLKPRKSDSTPRRTLRTAVAGADARAAAKPARRHSLPPRARSEAARLRVVRAADAAGPAPVAWPVAAAVTPNALFNNQTPTLAYDPAENQVVGGHIHGDLHPVDPDSTRLTYTATAPAQGSVVINPDGTFDYTPGTNYTGQDMFDVTVSDAASGFHIHGFAGLLNLLSFGLLGASGHKKTETVFVGDQRTVVASGFDSPVDFRFLPDGRTLVAEKGGAIKVIDTNGAVLAQALTTLSVNTLGERGISGLAVDPQFGVNGHIYVAYTTSDVTDRLSRFTVTGNTALPGSEMVLLESPGTVAAYHHGGGLAFGPDGKLYWGKGDNTTGSNAQDLTNIYGKILRINPDGSTPSDNPVLPSGALPQIYAYGLRNPFRLTFTPTGELLVADVGSSSFEELDNVVAGGNYGWPGSEGICTNNCAGLINPAYTYPHGSGAAFSSVLAFDPTAVFIADEVQGWIKVLTCDATYTSCGDPQDFDPHAGPTVALAPAPGGDGSLYQLIYQPGTLVRFAQAADV